MLYYNHMPPKNTVLQLSAVTKKFNGLKAVDSLSLTIRPGEIFGLIGPNGSGKTTTIKMIAGLYRPDGGDVFVGGRDVVEYPTEAKRQIGYVPDEPTAYDRLTGREFLQFVGELFGLERGLRENRIDALLDSFGIRRLADGLFMGFSRGTKQKIVLCAALLHEPALLLIDEPMVGLDPQSVQVAKKLLRDYAARGGAIFLSTHTLSVAEDLCRRFGVLREGRLAAEGDLSDIRRAAALKEGTLEECYLRLLGSL